MTIQDLLDYGSNKRSNLTSTTTVSFGGNDYIINDLININLLAVYDAATGENEAGTRSVILPGLTFPVVVTNAQYISLIRSAIAATQKIYDIYYTIVGQINNSILTTEGQIDSAWASLDGSYNSNRVIQSNFETLSAAISAIFIPKIVSGTTVKTGVFPIFKSVVVDGSGNAIIHITNTGLSNGTALFSNAPDLTTFNLQAQENASPHFGGVPVLSNGNKTLTVSVTKSVALTLLGINILGATQSASGSTVYITIWGN